MPNDPIPSWAREMAKLNYNPMADLPAARFATSGPSSVIPPDYSKAPPSTPPPISGFARRETPIAPPPGVAICDKLMDAADVKDKAELMRQSTAAADQCVFEVAAKAIELLTQQQAMMMAMAMANAPSGAAKKPSEEEVK